MYLLINLFTGDLFDSSRVLVADYCPPLEAVYAYVVNVFPYISRAKQVEMQLEKDGREISDSISTAPEVRETSLGPTKNNSASPSLVARSTLFGDFSGFGGEGSVNLVQRRSRNSAAVVSFASADVFMENPLQISGRSESARTSMQAAATGSGSESASNGGSSDTTVPFQSPFPRHETKEADLTRDEENLFSI